MNRSSPPPIFIVGSERSGSNLLRVLLGNHSALTAPVDPHYFDAWSKNLGPYGDLREGQNMALLVEDMLEYANHKFNGWDLELDIPEAIASSAPRSFWEAFDLLYRAKARMHGKTGYACKGNHIFNYAFQVKAHWPDARLLYLFRDPRDHCASWKQKPMNLKTVYDMILKWKTEQTICLDLVTKHGIDMHFLPYEDLIADTPKVMAGVLQFCGLPVEETCFETNPDKNRDEAKRFVYWENLDKPILRENKRKYRKVLTPEEVNIVETIAGPQMDQLGYECDSKRDWTPPMLHHLRLWAQRRAVDRKVQDKQKKELEILQSKLELLWKIRKRARQRGKPKPLLPSPAIA